MKSFIKTVVITAAPMLAAQAILMTVGYIAHKHAERKCRNQECPKYCLCKI